MFVNGNVWRTLCCAVLFGTLAFDALPAVADESPFPPWLGTWIGEGSWQRFEASGEGAAAAQEHPAEEAKILVEIRIYAVKEKAYVAYSWRFPGKSQIGDGGYMQLPKDKGAISHADVDMASAEAMRLTLGAHESTKTLAGTYRTIYELGERVTTIVHQFDNLRAVARQRFRLGEDQYVKLRQRMVARHLRSRDITDKRVLDAVSRIPRDRFVADAFQRRAFAATSQGGPAARLTCFPRSPSAMSRSSWSGTTKAGRTSSCWSSPAAEIGSYEPNPGGWWKRPCRNRTPGTVYFRLCPCRLWSRRWDFHDRTASATAANVSARVLNAVELRTDGARGLCSPAGGISVACTLCDSRCPRDRSTHAPQSHRIGRSNANSVTSYSAPHLGHVIAMRIVLRLPHGPFTRGRLPQTEVAERRTTARVQLPALKPGTHRWVGLPTSEPTHRAVGTKWGQRCPCKPNLCTMWPTCRFGL